jgi:hypothetical protein
MATRMQCEEITSYPCMGRLRNYLRNIYPYVEVEIMEELEQSPCDKIPYIIIDKHTVSVAVEGSREKCCISLYLCLKLSIKYRYLVSNGGRLKYDLLALRTEEEISYVGNYSPNFPVEGVVLRKRIKNFLELANKNCSKDGGTA